MIRVIVLLLSISLLSINCDDPVSSKPDNNNGNDTIVKPIVNPFVGKWNKFIDSIDDGVVPIETKRELYCCEFVVTDTLGNGYWKWPEPDWRIFEKDSMYTKMDSLRAQEYKTKTERCKYTFTADSLFFIKIGNAAIHTDTIPDTSKHTYLIKNDTLIYDYKKDSYKLKYIKEIR